MNGTASQVPCRSRPRVSLLDFPPAEVRRFLAQRLRQQGLREAYLFGSFAGGTAGAWSDIDLIVVQESELPPVERARAFACLGELGVAVDVLVYTPAEFAAARENPVGFWSEFERLHERLV